MDTVKQIFYVDGHYSYEKDLRTKEYYSNKKDLKADSTSLFFYNAYGYVENHDNNIVIAFVKKNGVTLKETLQKGENIIEGLVIPDGALVSNVRTYDNSILVGVKKSDRVAATWRDIQRVSNSPIYDCAIMYTEGTLYKIEDDHIVLRDTETIRIHPKPIKNHPPGKPLWYTIPISFITDIEVVS